MGFIEAPFNTEMRITENLHEEHSISQNSRPFFSDEKHQGWKDLSGFRQ
jgi:hypothetical protein